MASYVSTFTGDGSEVHFTAGFPVLRLTDLAVVVDNVWLTLGTDYSVSGTTAVPVATLAVAPGVGAVVTLRSAVGYTPTDPAAVTTAAPTLNDTDTALWEAISNLERLNTAIGNGRIYADTAAGLAATLEGEYFNVLGTGEYILYVHDAGPVATEVARYPTSAAFQDLVDDTAASIAALEADTDAAIVALEATVQGPAAMNEQFIGDDSTAYWHFSKLFGASDKGFWFDAAQTGGVFQDAAATTPVTASGQPALAVKANFSGANSYPNLLSPARTNLASALWTKSNVTVTADSDTAPDGTVTADTVVENTANSSHYFRRAIPGIVGTAYRVRAMLRPNGRTRVAVALTSELVEVTLSGAGTINSHTAGVSGESITATGSYYLVEFQVTATAATETYGVYLRDGSGNAVYVGDGTSGVYHAYSTVERMSINLPLFQTDSAKAPTYTESSGLKFLRFDGSNDSLRLRDLDFDGCTKVTMLFAARQRAFGTTASIIAEHSIAGGATTGGLMATFNNSTPSGALGGAFGDDASHLLVNNGPAASVERLLTAVIEFYPGGATADERISIRINGAAVDETQVVAVGTATDAVFGTHDLYLGGREGTSLFAQIDLFAGVVIGRGLTEAELTAIERTLELRLYGSSSVPPGPVGTTYTITPAAFSDTGTIEDKGSHILTSPFAKVDISTEATSMDVVTYNDIYADYPELTAVGVLVNGAYNQSISPGGLGEVTSTITLPAGPKVVSLVNGPQSKPVLANPPIGTWVTSVSASDLIFQVIDRRYRMLVYGDSIAVGSAATPPHEKAWVAQVRAAIQPASVALEAWGYRTLHEDANTPTLRKAFVKKLMAYGADIMWLAIGTNDYALSKWSAADFGTAYAALLDDIHAIMPAVKVYAQSPLLRGTDGTLGDYRTQISTAASSRTSFVQFVDGTAILTTGDLADGVHPSTAGHTTYANYIKTLLGW